MSWHLQISLFSNFFIKNWSYGTIHTFKNYFVTVFSVFSFQFQQNKFYPNVSLVCFFSVWFVHPRWVFAFSVCLFFFFFFFKPHNLTFQPLFSHISGSRIQFTGSTNLIFSNFFIKNGSHDRDGNFALPLPCFAPRRFSRPAKMMGRGWI